MALLHDYKTAISTSGFINNTFIQDGIPSWSTPYRGFVVDIVPCDDIMHACGHGRSYSEDEPLFKSPPKQPQHTVSLGAVREVGHPISAWIPHPRVRVLLLEKNRTIHTN